MITALVALLALSVVIGIPAGLVLASIRNACVQQEADDQARPSAEIITLSEHRAGRREAA